MRYLYLAVILACVSMHASALVVEPEQKPAISKSTTSKTVSAPAKTSRTATPQIVQTKAPPSEGSVRFYQAIQNGNLDMARLYLSKGADINCDNCSQDNLTPLMNRSAGYPIEHVKFLIENGANINQQKANGITALMLAAGSGTTGTITLLIENGADVSLTDQNGNDALFYSMRVFGFWQAWRENDNSNQSALLIKYLISKGASINQQGSDGISPLMFLASRCYPEAIKLFLSLGADPNLKTKLGETALMIAEKTAVNSAQGSTCNQTYSVLSDPERYRAASSTSPPTPSVGIPASNNAPSNRVYSTYAGNYSGNYSGDDNGSFQVTVEQDGNIKLTGKSLRNNQAFTGNGKMNSDGSLGITLGNISTGATFQGSINPKTGGLYGTWKNGEQAGNFSGSKQTAQASNPIEAIGGLLNVLNKALAK